MSNEQKKRLTFTESSLAAALESVQALHEMGCELIAGVVFQQAAEQHQGEPIMLTAVAELVDDGDGGLEPLWILEGGTAELFAGMTLLVADNAPDLCQEDGSAEVYAHADSAQVERLREQVKHANQDKAAAVMMQRMAEQKLDEREAQLRKANAFIKLSAERLPRKHQTIRSHALQLMGEIDAAMAASKPQFGPLPGAYPDLVSTSPPGPGASIVSAWNDRQDRRS
ncbi:hypothetical protein [Pseudomonas asplenii]|uniref:Uncharacterized protein n=1 Tax=Pseudomonas asplenii TaxID=53407 RepID=A0A1H6NTZ7_9PSED|nr:hypothetical protein [Pseudomonas fuscovaginae]SEI17004.1 hypothetical protein SAMN05216581_3283 [Pseudomonas fuscovaginae]